jgi:hypothetical protein
MGARTDAELAELDPDELRAELSARLTRLPPDAYLRCVAAFVAEYQWLYHVSGLPAVWYRIVDAIVALARRAAAGMPVRDAAHALDRTSSGAARSRSAPPRAARLAAAAAVRSASTRVHGGRPRGRIY